MSEEKVSGRTTVVQRVILGAVGTILLGAIGSGVWQLAFSPSVDWLTRFIAGVSHRINDAAYESAALDPRPLASLILLLLVTQVPLWFAAYFLIGLFLDPILRFFLPRRTVQDDKRPGFRRIRALAIVGIILSLGLYVVARLGFSAANQAVSVWRIFHMNLARCAPYLTADEEKRYEARFRSMHREKDYLEIERDFLALGSKHAIEIQRADHD
jgi:hypothetical protein